MSLSFNFVCSLSIRPNPQYCFLRRPRLYLRLNSIQSIITISLTGARTLIMLCLLLPCCSVFCINLMEWMEWLNDGNWKELTIDRGDKNVIHVYSFPLSNVKNVHVGDITIFEKKGVVEKRYWISPYSSSSLYSSMGTVDIIFLKSI